MNVDYKECFFRSVKKIIDPALKEKVEHVIKSVKAAKTLKDISGLKKLKGEKTSYRIRLGDYRIGVNIENDMVTFDTFGHRKNIYKKFP